MSQEPEKTDTKGTKVKLVKIKTIKQIMVNGNLIPEDKEIEVEEEIAKEFCDKEIVNHYAFGGQRSEDAIDCNRIIIRRAKRI